MSGYRLTPEAEQDLDDIADGLIVSGGSALVRHVHGALEEAMEFLSETPGAGHSRSDLTDEPVRFWSVSPISSFMIQPCRRSASRVSFMASAIWPGYSARPRREAELIDSSGSTPNDEIRPPHQDQAMIYAIGNMLLKLLLLFVPNRWKRTL